MEFRSQSDDDHGTTSAPSSLSLKPSAFSKPTLSPSPSLLSPKPPSKNGNIFIQTTPSQSPAQTPSNSSDSNAQETSYRYKECLRNHAANIGVHVVDGCGEFMPFSEDPLKCAACSCHRSFHRKELIARPDARGMLLLPPPHPSPHHQPKPFNLSGFPQSPMMAFGIGNTSGSGGTTTESSSEERMNAGSVPRKRFRTKFTGEQKEKMLAFAESIGWRIQKHDEALVEQFCVETGVRRQVLKVWMHNNKHVIRRQQQTMSNVQQEHQ